MNVNHFITLPDWQAQWWFEIAQSLGLCAQINQNKVGVIGKQKDIEAA